MASAFRRADRTAGHAVIEIALLSPWVFFLFVGALDMGFYAYSMIATQNAARVAVEYTAYRLATAADSSGACQMALGEMNTLPNLKQTNSCGSAPLVVTARSFTDSDGAPATEVTVTYTTDQLIPFPGVTGKMTITRKVQMRIL